MTTVMANAIAYEATRKRAEALAKIDRAKTAFFANVSHELCTPLPLMLEPTRIVGMTDNVLPEVRLEGETAGMSDLTMCPSPYRRRHGRSLGSVPTQRHSLTAPT